VLSSFFEDARLVSFGREGRYEGALTDHWEQSPDGLVWRFFLRPGLTFHDGVRIDAATVAAALSTAIGATSTHPGLRDVLRVEAQGPLELVVRLRRPSSFLLDALAVETIRSPGQKPAGAGAFRVESQQKGEASLVNFPGYYRGEPAIDRVEVRPYENARSAWSAMLRGEIDVLYEVTPDAMDFIENSSATQIRSFLRPYVYTFALNNRHPVLGRREVRIALNQAVNRDDIVKGPFGSRGEAATDGIWPRHWAYDHSLPTFHYAPAEAGKRLDAAGLPVKGGGHQMPSRFRFTCLLPQDNGRVERMGLMLQRQLIEVGIDMQLEPLPATPLIQRMKSGAYDAFLTDLLSQNLEYAYIMWHSPEAGSPSPFTFGYKGADAALDHLRTARTDDETRAAVKELQRVMYEDPPAVFLCWSRISRAISVRFQLPPVTERDILSTVSQWRPAQGASASAAVTRPAAAPATSSP
jgi:peptide/nickel transport system substrate-binding protein